MLDSIKTFWFKRQRVTVDKGHRQRLRVRFRKRLNRGRVCSKRGPFFKSTSFVKDTPNNAIVQTPYRPRDVPVHISQAIQREQSYQINLESARMFTIRRFLKFRDCQTASSWNSGRESNKNSSKVTFIVFVMKSLFDQCKFQAEILTSKFAVLFDSIQF